MCFVQDDKRKVGIVVGFGFEMYGKFSCRESLNEQRWEMYLCVYVFDDIGNKCLGKINMFKSFE